LMADNAEEIRAAGAEMLMRLEKAVDHLSTLRKGLMGAVKGYNEFVGSMDSRVMVQARRMKELGVASATDLELPSDVTEALRESRSVE
jgi:DNA recombination protein RmuC